MMKIAGNTMNEKTVVVETSERIKYLFLLSFGLVLLLAAFFFNSPHELFQGSLRILSSPANLITDYFQLSNVGAALLNAAVMTFVSIGIIALSRGEVSGPLIAAILTVTGFSLFGKNLYNSLPIMLGVYSYTRLMGLPFRDQLPAALFGTALGPLVSELSFNLGLPLYLGIPLGIGAGILVGLILPVLAAHFFHFHQGFNLNNIGFTCGIIGTFFVGALRLFGTEIATVSILSKGNNSAFIFILYPLFLAVFLFGLWRNGWSFRGFSDLLKQSGKLRSDFVTIVGFAPVLINMGLLGILTTSYVLAVGGELNGPVIGGIFTVVGFGAYGKHIRNVIPVILGIFLVGLVHPGSISSVPAVLAALFGTTLAPISGYYGPLAGLIAGGIHMTMAMNVSYLHAGMNLYNNGFAGGFVAAALVPIIEAFLKMTRKKGTHKGT